MDWVSTNRATRTLPPGGGPRAALRTQNCRPSSRSITSTINLVVRPPPPTPPRHCAALGGGEGAGSTRVALLWSRRPEPSPREAAGRVGFHRVSDGSRGGGHRSASMPAGSTGMIVEVCPPPPDPHHCATRGEGRMQDRRASGTALERKRGVGGQRCFNYQTGTLRDSPFARNIL
jgi:hypothetical protein